MLGHFIKKKSRKKKKKAREEGKKCREEATIKKSESGGNYHERRKADKDVKCTIKTQHVSQKTEEKGRGKGLEVVWDPENE